MPTTTYLNGESSAGGKLKETSTTHWDTPNTGATNSNGFLALPGGYRYLIDGLFHDIKISGYWWTSTFDYSYYSWARQIDYNETNVWRSDYSKEYGFSIRCMKD